MNRIQTDSQEEWLPLEHCVVIVVSKFMVRVDIFDPL